MPAPARIGCLRAGFSVRVAAFAIALAAVALPVSPAGAQDRVALVIGNDRYDNLPADKQLVKAVNDARAIGGTLEKLGFKVIRGENLTRSQMVDHIFNFTQSVKPGDTAVMFFAGHGVSFSGGNYLLPADVPLPRPGEEQRARNLSLGEADIIADIQERKPRVLVMMLDACRDNPFRQPGITRSIGGETGLSRGREAEGVFTIYSAGFGQSALDSLGPDDKSPNSIFTRSLIPALTRPNVHLADMVIDMRDEVARLAATVGHQQYPAYYDQTRGGRVYLSALPSAKPAERLPSTSLIAPKPAPRFAALLIGNLGYSNLARLRTPENDVKAVAQALKNAGFDHVVTKTDLDRAQMQAALREFAADASSAKAALIYFSGHGARLAGDRFLMATDARIADQRDLVSQGIRLNDVIDATKGADTRVVVVDSNQDDPFASPNAPLTRDIETIDPRGTIVFYSAGPKEAALDGTGQLAPFTQSFVKYFSTPGLSLGEAFARTRDEVAAVTKKSQTPVIYGSPAASSLLAR